MIPRAATAAGLGRPTPVAIPAMSNTSLKMRALRGATTASANTKKQRYNRHLRLRAEAALREERAMESAGEDGAGDGGMNVVGAQVGGTDGNSVGLAEGRGVTVGAAVG